MKIQIKIMLWISGTVVLSTLLFSTFVFFKMVDQPFLLIDKELKHMAKALVVRMEKTADNKGGYDLTQMTYKPDHYWIEVTAPGGNLLYQSRIAKYTEILPDTDNKNRYQVKKIIPKNPLRQEQGEDNEVLFRVNVIETSYDNLPVSVRIARPIVKIEKELNELLYSFLVSLSLWVLVIVFASYKLAGAIMSPVSSITALSKEISEQSLDKRIPLNNTKDELYDLSSSLNRMFDRLQYSFLRQKEFIGNASHELKSPITRLLLAQEDMLHNMNLPASANNGLMKQLNTTRRMSQLVKHLLDLSRLEQQETLDRSRLDLTTLVRHVLEEYAELFLVKNIRLDQHLTKTIYLYGDSEKLYRLLVNLIDNSIRYNLEAEGRIIVKGWQTGADIVLEVSNTGIGIPDEDIDLVFEQFYRVEKSRALDHGGAGLGLAIAKKIVQLHGGTITISNEPDRLIKVRVSIPLAY